MQIPGPKLARIAKYLSTIFQEFQRIDVPAQFRGRGLEPGDIALVNGFRTWKDKAR
jgi:hypothetical protein